jgi:hypothetical protein
MSWYKIVAVSVAILFVFGFAMTDSAVAGEKVKWHGTSLVTEMKQIEVGDVEGHVMLLSKQKQLYINEATGQKTVSISVNTMDLNPAAKQFSVKGHGWSVDKDGDKIMRVHEGKPVGENHWKGTWRYVSGTGKYEGIKGEGIWDSYSMGPQMPSYMEVEGEMEMPKK